MGHFEHGPFVADRAGVLLGKKVNVVGKVGEQKI